MARATINNKGQSSLPEYVVTFFLVIAAGVAMTTYIQRSLQAKMKDGRDYMVSVASNACDADCQAAARITGDNIPGEYEPYYRQDASNVSRESVHKTALIGGVHVVSGQSRLFDARIADNAITVADGTSTQLPPKDAQ